MLSFILFGDQRQASPFLNVLPNDQLKRIQFVHTPHTIDANIPFMQALRKVKEVLCVWH
ncbi:phosphate acyltransferase [Actinobacillus equuli]|nr:phosphate acyltransferase [Actinobacillus equuli]